MPQAQAVQQQLKHTPAPPSNGLASVQMKRVMFSQFF
jgi:hypothetical protein